MNCRDVNAGSFHIVLANLIGIDNESFIIDKTRDAEVWNQAVYKYKSSFEEASLDSYKNMAWNTKRLVKATTQLSYIIEVAPSDKAEFSENSIESVNYEYYLELDEKNRIIGGKWISKDYPDFIWKIEKPVFTEKFKGIEEIYKASLIENQIDSSRVSNEMQAIEMVYLLDMALEKYNKKHKHYKDLLENGFVSRKLKEFKFNKTRLLVKLESVKNPINSYKMKNRLNKIEKSIIRFEGLEEKFRNEYRKSVEKLEWLKEQETHLLSFIEE